jgi:serine protease AprX
MKKLTSAIICAGLTCSWAVQAAQKISPDAAQVDLHSTINAIIQWKANAVPDNAKITALGGRLITPFKSINGGLYSLPASALATLEADSSIAYVSLDRPVHHKLDITAATINAPVAWSAGADGSGIGVAVIDSGVNNDPNLNAASGPGSRVVYQQNFTGGGDTNDHYGHGQHIAGIIASNASTESKPGGPIASYSRLFKGVAPGANILNLRVLDSNGDGTDSQVIAAIDQAIILKPLYNVRVINLSLGRPAVEAAWRAGIVVVAAAGNDGRDNTYNNLGYGTITAPGNDPLVITVGSMKTEGTYTRADDLIASYSSKGPTQVDHIAKPDLVAPGNLVVSLLAAGSTLSNQYPSNQVANSYFQEPSHGPITGNSNNFFVLSGTSMAAAVVSGAAADLLHAKPTLTPDQVKILLMQTASKTFPISSTVTDSTTNQTFTDYYDIFTVGAGYLDLGAAMSALSTVPATGTAMSPVAIYDPTTTNVTLTYNVSSVFNLASIQGNKTWAPQAIWAPSELTANKCLWGASGDTASKCLWGASGDTASKCLWGASSVSSSSDSFAESIAVTGEP